jgi:hypothetical protein
MEYHNPKPAPYPFSKLEIFLACCLVIPGLAWLFLVFTGNAAWLLASWLRSKLPNKKNVA